MKRQILFVDDEPCLLEGLKRMLRPMRHEWEMVFAGNGAEALACMERTRVDVVVSDVRMPGMNGVELLNQIKNFYPHTVRLLLSGQADMEVIMGAIGPTHQYLAKPCDAEVLKNTISRACSLGDLLTDSTIKELVSQIETMPSLPSLYIELEEELKSSDSSLKKAAAIVTKDLGMTAKILQIVNSAFFGIPRSISDPSQAVMFLGVETLKTLVLTYQIFQQLGQSVQEGLDVDHFWSHSFAVGVQARKIAEAEHADTTVVNAALAGGLLHDIGILLLNTSFPERFQKTMKLVNTQQCSLMEAERELLGATHAEIGAYLLGLWGLPTPVLEAVAFHHRPSESLIQAINPLLAVHVGNAMVIEKDLKGFEANAQGVDLVSLTELGLSDRLREWQVSTEVSV